MAPLPPKLEFNDGARVFEAPLPPPSATTTPLRNPTLFPLSSFYEIESTAAKILSIYLAAPSPLLKIALQFPDPLLPDAAAISWALESALTSLFTTHSLTVTILPFILGDTTYAGCCVDNVSAAHLGADVIVHYGRSCLSKASRVPVIYIFGKLEMDVKDLGGKVKGVGGKVVVVYDVMYHYAVEEIGEALEGVLGKGNVVLGGVEMGEYRDTAEGGAGKVKGGAGEQGEECCGGGVCGSSKGSSLVDAEGGAAPDSPLTRIGGLSIPVPVDELEEYTVLYIGDNKPQLTNVAMRCLSTGINLHVYNPEKREYATEVGGVIGKELNRRFLQCSKVRRAGVIGIVVATLSVDRFMGVVGKIQRQIEEAGRSSYLFVVGKVNVAKLSNFGEIEGFVLVACPESTLLDSREFHLPVVTPWELEIALGEREWGMYSVEFGDYLEGEGVGSGLTGKSGGGNEEGGSASSDDDADAPFYDPVSGQYMTVVKTTATVSLSTQPGGGVVTKYDSSAASFLKNREYQGIDGKADEGEVVRKAIKGDVGIAAAYTQINDD